jgi:hypothetical protein
VNTGSGKLAAQGKMLAGVSNIASSKTTDVMERRAGLRRFMA